MPRAPGRPGCVRLGPCSLASLSFFAIRRLLRLRVDCAAFALLAAEFRFRPCAAFSARNLLDSCQEVAKISHTRSNGGDKARAIQRLAPHEETGCKPLAKLTRRRCRPRGSGREGRREAAAPFYLPTGKANERRSPRLGEVVAATSGDRGLETGGHRSSASAAASARLRPLTVLIAWTRSSRSRSGSATSHVAQQALDAGQLLGS